MPGKRVQFDDETWHALDLLARDRMQDFQELADEAFRDLLQKHGRPTDLKTALRQSAGVDPVAEKPSKKSKWRGGCSKRLPGFQASHLSPPVRGTPAAFCRAAERCARHHLSCWRGVSAAYPRRC